MSEGCMVPNCDQPAVELVANDAPLMSPKYAERWVCRWHQRNPFPERAHICVHPDGSVAFCWELHEGAWGA